ncbi:DNA mismatch repair endonuclease MutL [Idiomarina seosinensis]|uniref:DNA mismatch repair endonuclease MutL n=1 Tax=Idiomarina seosinensis TaxID=281739 RepID=UPI00384AE81C
MVIKQLPIELANQIAAGEVVERPASVVKELVENALDAGADKLLIDIEQGGIKRIKIRDNGCGIERDQLALALSRHATSKIACLEDLESIASLGFRGEALASISSVSRLRLTSKPAAQSEAWQAWTSGRDMAVQVEPAAHPDGTTIDIQDIFFNTPARRKFLRTEKTEFAHIDETVKRIALSRFDVDITLSHQGKRVRHYPSVDPDSDQQQRRRLVKATGAQFAEQALAIQAQTGSYQLTGWVATAEHCRHQGDIQYCFVNGRIMRDKLLSHALRQAYERYLLADTVPTYVIYLWLPADQLDVNVHPAKHEVRFHQQRQVHDFILQAVADALSQASAISADGPAIPADTKHQSGRPTARQHQYKTSVPLTEARSGYRAGSSILPNAVQEATPADALPEYRALAVFKQHWLLMQKGDEPAWLNVAAVAQQLLSNQLHQQLQHGLNGQPLLVEVVLDLSKPGLQSLSAEDVEWLNRCGFNFRQHGRRLTVDTVPAMLRHGNVAQHCLALIQQIQANKDSDSVARWLANFAKTEHVTVSAAEHYMKRWQQELEASAQYMQPIDVPTCWSAGS